ncbi:MAG: hypothetical protein J1F63_00695 [Oscillospiraceae bacterium]|nr:hypothetical protein [Oscillospiraceae bacterium]
MGRRTGPRRSCSPVGVGILAFVFGIFTAMILPVTLLAVIEGGLIIVLGIILLRR